MKYLTNTFSPMMTDEKFTGFPISLAQAKLESKNAKSAVGHELTAQVLGMLLEMPVAFNRESLELVPGDEVICVVPNFRASEAREFTRDEVLVAGFRAFRVEIEKTPKIEVEVEKMNTPVKWTWNNGLGKRDRHPRCLVISPSGDVHWFNGTDVPGVVKVLGTNFRKNGKWSNTDFSCVSPQGTIHVSWMQDFGTGSTLPQDSWEDAFKWLQAKAPLANSTQFEEVIRLHVKNNAARFDENRAALLKMRST